MATSPRVYLLALLAGHLLLAGVAAEDPPQSRAATPQPRGPNYYGLPPAERKHAGAHQKCARQSIILARQMLVHELAHLNQLSALWFGDLDHEELLESQKQSLSNIVMSGAGTLLLNSKGQPLIEIESSYFRPHQGAGAPQGPATVRLLRKHQDKCHLDAERAQFSYTVGLALGPLEHHLDVVYNLPRELQLSQPIEWRYGQVSISVPKLHYEVTFRQAAQHGLAGARPEPRGACPLEVSDVTFLAHGGQKQKQPGGHQGLGISITSSGLAPNNQTQLQVERLFDDYTRPAISHRLRQMLEFYLNSKTFPLAALAPS